MPTCWAQSGVSRIILAAASNISGVMLGPPTPAPAPLVPLAAAATAAPASCCVPSLLRLALLEVVVVAVGLVAGAASALALLLVLAGAGAADAAASAAEEELLPPVRAAAARCMLSWSLASCMHESTSMAMRSTTCSVHEGRGIGRATNTLGHHKRS